MSTTKFQKQRQKPDDRWVFRLVYPLMILGAIHIGNDNALHDLVRMSSYYTDLLLAIVCTYGAGIYFRYLFQRMERQFPWDQPLKDRIRYQWRFGLLLPLLVILASELVYLSIFLGIPAVQSSMLYLELPLVLIFLLLINLFYFILYYRMHHLVSARSTAAPSRSLDTPSLLVQAGAKVIRLPVHTIAYCRKQERLTFVLTLAGEMYWSDLPLEKIGEELGARNFYQLNRQVIASRQSIRAYTPTATRKLAIELQPVAQAAVYVSKAKATDFIQWFGREAASENSTVREPKIQVPVSNA